MSRGHNKKRNVGIVYDQLVATVSKAMVEKDQTTANKALSIIKRHFSPGTELYREFRLFSALVKTRNVSDALASRILEETKNAAVSYDVKRLRSEKSSLIKEINKTFDKDTFYKTPVKDYRLLATIHTLMNEWRSTSPNIDVRVRYESVLHEWLTNDSEVVIAENLKTPDVNDLTVRIMRESFNKKYGSVLSETQRDFIRKLALEGDHEGVVETMSEQKTEALRALAVYQRECDSDHVREKIPSVISMVESLRTDDTSDKNVVKFLTVAQLCSEILENDDE